MRRERGAALLEFAFVWPLLLLLGLGGIQLSVWSSEAFAARASAAAGARAGSAAGAGPAVAQQVALSALQHSLVGVRAVPGCPRTGSAGTTVWVCAQAVPSGVRVQVGGLVPALVPLVPGAGGLPVRADVTVGTEAYR